MRAFSISFLLMIFVMGIRAQKFSDTLYATTAFIRFNPLGLIDVNDLNLSIGVEKRFSAKSSVAFDFAYLIYDVKFRDQGKTRGIMLRPAYRLFTGESFFFIEGELHYKLVTHRIIDWVGRGVVNNVPSYFEYTRFRLRKEVFGVHLKAGRQYNVSEKIWLEVYLGIGIHFRQYRIANHPDWQYDLGGDFPRQGSVMGKTDVLPAIPAGLRVLYRLSK